MDYFKRLIQERTGEYWRCPCCISPYDRKARKYNKTRARRKARRKDKQRIKKLVLD